jgi:hypothetical protein
MQSQRSALARVQRAVVLQVLRDDHPQWWTRTELERDLGPTALTGAMAKLAADDVIQVDGERVRASRCVRHLDALGLIAA